MDLLSYPEAAALIAEQAQRLAALTERRIESVPLAAALDRVLAQPLFADRDLPPFDRSTRDGYAVQAAALASGAALPVTGTLPAGQPATTPLAPGAALEIMTGAPLPQGADAVVMLEHVDGLDRTIRLAPGRTLRAGDNVVPTGSEARQGDTLVPAGVRLTPAHIAALATVGAIDIAVCARTRVAILATGDELVEIGQTPLPHQIRNSNSYSIAAQVERAGGLPERLGIAGDDPESLREHIGRAAQTVDLLLLSGGVSAGRFDFVEQALAEHGAVFHFTGVRIQPGRPAVFGELPPGGNRPTPLPFFGLPGNPVSTMVTFLLFAAPLLRALAGDMDPAPRFAQATLAAAEAASPLTRFLPAYLSATWNRASVRRIPWQGSGDLAATARSNCFVVLPPNTAQQAGATVQVLMP